MAAMEPITLYSGANGPNPYKVAIVLEELGIPYETKWLEMAEMKEAPYLSISPNGRVPAIIDPNNDGFVVWESGAIIEYLVENYNRGQKIVGKTDKDKYLCRQWLYFQASGQGPYFGQYTWFRYLHPEKNITSAIDRYANEAKRVVRVLNEALKRNGTGWLVGDSCTYADLSFVTWNTVVPMILGEDVDKLFQECPLFKQWQDAMTERPAVATVLQRWREKFKQP